jgi:hypothetical protein
MRTRNLLAVMSCLALLAGCSRVSSDWKSAQTADTAEAYQQFIREHGDSEYAARAEQRIQQITDDSDWKQAAALDTRDAYEQYVAQHADGKSAQEARARIENFKLAASGAAGGSPAVPAVATPVTPAAASATVPAKAPAAVFATGLSILYRRVARTWRMFPSAVSTWPSTPGVRAALA